MHIVSTEGATIMSTCEHSDTFTSPLGHYESADCTDTATHRVVYRDLSFANTPFEHIETVLCEPHKDALTTEIDVDDRRFELVLIDGNVNS